MTALAVLSLLIWIYLLVLRGRFWQAGPVLTPDAPRAAPPVAIVVPARDEAPFIERSLRSLLAQDYAGPLRVVLVDDGSSDGTGDIARRIADPRLSVLTGAPRPAGWSGKLWAESQGIAAICSEPPVFPAHPRESGDPALRGWAIPINSQARLDSSLRGNEREGNSDDQNGLAEFILLTDADIDHDPRHLATLVAQAERGDLDIVSEMVALSCESRAERALVPAFVFFFQLLYPFRWVNDPRRATAAAAGGTILVRRRALERIGGIGAIRGALIDDVALATAVKKGGPIWLGHSALARSMRPYPRAADIWRMVARTAYVQLRHSPPLLALATLGLTLAFLLPPLAAL